MNFQLIRLAVKSCRWFFWVYASQNMKPRRRLRENIFNIIPQLLLIQLSLLFTIIIRLLYPPVTSFKYLIMSGAGDLKNSISSLKRTLTRNGILQKMDLSINHFEEEYLQNSNPAIFLKLTHYMMIQYSPILYTKILEKYPNIKMGSDKDFITACYVCIRELFDTYPSLNVDQFLTSKFLELKVKFVDELTNLVLIWLKENKKVKPVNDERVKVGKAEKAQKKVTKYSQDHQEPRRINIRPTVINPKAKDDAQELEYEKPRSLKYKPEFEYRQDVQEEMNQSGHQLNKYLNKNQSNRPKPYPKPTYDEYDERPINSNYTNQKHNLKDQPTRLKMPKTDQQQKSILYDLQPEPSKHEVQQQSVQSQINDLLQLVGNVSVTVNELVGKFNVFQNNVSDWVKNINAKVDILESTVKRIKDNM